MGLFFFRLFFLFLPAQHVAARHQLNDSGSDSISLILKLGVKLVCKPNFNNTLMISLIFTHSTMCVCVLPASVEYKRIDPALRRPPSPSRLTPEINIWLPAQPLTSFVCRLVPGKERKGKERILLLLGTFCQNRGHKSENKHE